MRNEIFTRRLGAQGRAQYSLTVSVFPFETNDPMLNLIAVRVVF